MFTFWQQLCDTNKCRTCIAVGFMLFTSQIAAGQMQTVTQIVQKLTGSLSAPASNSINFGSIFFLSWIVQIFKHKEFRKRLYLFSVNALIYILKHLVYTTASRRSQQSFGRYMQRMAFQCRRHARNQTRNQKQDLSLGSWKDFLLDFKKCLLKSGKQRWSYLPATARNNRSQ